MDNDRYGTSQGSIASHEVTILVDKQTGKTWILEGNNRHDAHWREVEGGPANS